MDAPTFTENKNVVANMSVQEYFKRKSLEQRLDSFPDVEFIALPVLHDGNRRAIEVAKSILKNKPDIFLYEDAIAYTGTNEELEKKIQEDPDLPDNYRKSLGASNEPFFKEILSNLSNYVIYKDTYEEKSRSVKQLVDKVAKIEHIFTSMHKINLSTELEKGDVDGAFQKLKFKLNQEGGFLNYQNERDFLILNNFGPRIFEMVNRKPELLKKGKIKVLYFIGASHEESVIDKMINRGDDLQVERTEEFKEFKIKREHFIWILLVNYFLDDFFNKLDKNSEYYFEIVKILKSEAFQSFLLKSPKVLIESLADFKKQSIPYDQFLDRLRSLIAN